MDGKLSEALAPVLDDLRNSGGPVPDVRDAQWSNFPGQVTAMLYAADDCGQGVSAMAAEPLPQRIASVADQVQEWAVEELCRIRRPATWPECTWHPDSHPMTAEVRDGRAVWTCPRSGQASDRIGSLRAPASLDPAVRPRRPGPGQRVTAQDHQSRAGTRGIRQLTCRPISTVGVRVVVRRASRQGNWRQARRTRAGRGVRGAGSTITP